MFIILAGLPHTQGTQGNSRNFQIIETSGNLEFFF